MRILLVAHADAPWTPRYARGLAGRGHEVRVISQHPGTVPGVETTTLGEIPRSAAGKLLRTIALARAIREHAQRHRPDVLFAPFLTTNALAATASGQGPRVVSARGSDVLSYPGEPLWRAHARPPVVRLVCRRAARVHAVSPNLVSPLLRAGVPRERIDCFCVGVDLGCFKAVPARRHPHRIVCTRQHDPRYDLGTLILALSRLRERGVEFEATLAGGGPLLEEHRSQVARLRLDSCVRLPGPLPHAECPALLAGADLYVSPALCDGASSSTLEAMASCLLPVLARHAANEYWVEHERTGLLFEPGNVEDLTRCLERGLRDVELHRRAAAPNRERIEREACFETNLARLEQTLEEAAGALAAG